MRYLQILFVLIFGMLTASSSIEAQSITGLWETYDDITKEKKAVIEIYEEQQLYFARIAESFVGQENATCQTCKGKNKGQPIIGLVIIEDIMKDGDEYSGGTILDPENGETYSCYLELMEENRLKVRGYLGFAIFGRTQYWLRKE